MKKMRNDKPTNKGGGGSKEQPCLKSSSQLRQDLEDREILLTGGWMLRSHGSMRGKIQEALSCRFRQKQNNYFRLGIDP